MITQSMPEEVDRPEWPKGWLDGKKLDVRSGPAEVVDPPEVVIVSLRSGPSKCAVPRTLLCYRFESFGALRQHLLRDTLAHMMDTHFVGIGDVFVNETSLRCSFDLRQRSDGRLLLDCVCEDPNAGWVLYSAKGLRFEGTTSSGEYIRASRLRILDLDGRQCLFGASEAVLGPAKLEGGAYEFTLTNLTFPDTKRGALPEPTVLSLVSDEEPIEFVLRPRNDYVEKQITVRRTNQPAVTAVLQVKSSKSFDHMQQTVADLCDAMSIIQGTKINWISCKIVQSEDSKQVILHERVTKPLVSLALNQQGGNDKRLPLDAVKVCFPMLNKRRTQLNLDSRIINAWLDARIDTDYLESRALKFVIVIEMLRAIVLHSQSPRRHLDEARWEQFLTYALPQLKVYLQTGMRCTKEVVEALTNRRKWESLNRRSFRSDILEALKILGATENRRTIELFIESRNKLIHEGRFRCTSELPPLENDAPRTPTDEYLFIAGLVDRIILQTFGLHEFVDGVSLDV